MFPSGLFPSYWFGFFGGQGGITSESSEMHKITNAHL